MTVIAGVSVDPGLLYGARAEVAPRVDEFASLPQIDWSAGKVEARAPFDLTPASKRWTADFVNHLGASAERRDPNAGLRISIAADAPLRSARVVL